jgi:hypothetical protein
LKKTTFNEIHRKHSLIKVLGIMILAILLLVNIAACATLSVITPDGTKCYSVRGWDVVVSDTATGETTNVYQGMYFGGIAVGSDGNVYAAEANQINILNVEKDIVYDHVFTSLTQGSITITGYKPSNVLSIPHGLILSPDGSKIYTTSPGKLFVIDIASKTVIKTVSLDDSNSWMGLSVSSDGSKIYTGSSVVDAVTFKLIPYITWNNPADITSGTALSSDQLNAVASVPGTFAYTPAAGNISSVGTQTLHAVFAPIDTTNYNTASKDVTINVLTSVQKIQQMNSNVQSFVTSGVLNKGQGNSLIVKLNAAMKNLNAGNTQAATNELNAFINEINADIKTGKISSAQGNALIDSANSVINAIK